MTMTIPTLPTIAAGAVVQPSDMAALAACANFLINKPIALIKDATGTQAISSSGTYITFTGSGVVQTDQDGMYSSSNTDRLTVQTPGWYFLRYSVTLASSTGTASNGAAFSTTGPNNPGGSGIQKQYWASYCDIYPGTAQGHGVWPFYFYQGDYIRIQWFAAAGDAGLTQGKNDVGGNGGMGSLLSLEYIGTTP